MTVLKGTIVSGGGHASGSATTPPALLDLICAKAGVPGLIAGTLNVRLPGAYTLSADFGIGALEVAELLGVESWPQDYEFELCDVEGCRGVIMRPTPSIYEDSILEIMATTHLRTDLGLDDGAAVQIGLESRGD